MASSHQLKTIVEVVGDAQAGKSTMVEGLVRRFAGQFSVLVVDGDPAMGFLSRFQSDQKISSTPLTEQVQLWCHNSDVSQESVDWYFEDLVQSFTLDNQSFDIIALGKLPYPLPLAVEQLVAYGINRLFAQYNWVLIDGRVPLLLDALEQPSLLRTLWVVSPTTHINDLTHPPSETMETPYGPSLLLNRLRNDTLPAPLQTQVDALLNNQTVKLIGRVPEVHPSERFNKDFTLLLSDCFYRMNLPLKSH